LKARHNSKPERTIPPTASARSKLRAFPGGPLFAAPTGHDGVIEHETREEPMLKSVSAAAVLLMLSTPAFAANPSQDDQISAPDITQAQEQTKAVQSPEQAADDIQIIIMGHGTQVQVPNPYKNPSPRMLTDAWAMRA
jgi:hypothetical protein